MKIRILDRILVAIAGLLVLAGCAALAAQLFFGKDVIGKANELLTGEQYRIWLIAALVLLVLLGCYCILLLFRHRGRKDKFVMQKTENGELSISLKAMESMVQKCLDQHPEIKTDNIHLENQRDGLLVRIRGTVAGGVSIPLTADTLQKQVKQYVTACSGVEVKGIRIQIESSGEDAKDAPFLIEPPVNNLLPKGGETLKETPESQPAKEETAAAPEEKGTETPSEPEKTVPSEEAAAAAVMAAAASLMDKEEIEDDRPIHQQLFSTQEEPCIMPLPPEDFGAAGEETPRKEDSEETKETQESEDKTDKSSTEEAKGEDNT